MINVSNKSSILFFITEEYPYGYGEPFIENEIELLSKSFRKIILISKGDSKQNKRNVPENITVVNNKFGLRYFDKILAIRYLFSRIFIKEIFYLNTTNFSFSKANISYAIISLARAKKVCNFIIKNYDINIYNSIYFYSYWYKDESIAACLLKKYNKKIISFTRAHGYDLYFERSNSGYLPYRTYTTKKLDRIFTISKHGLNYLKYKFQTDNIKLSYLGTNSIINKRDVKINNFSKRFLSCSMIYPNKRVDLIGDSIKNLSYKMTWDHYGDFMPFTDHKYRTNLKIICNDLKSCGHSINFTGTINNKELLNKIGKIKYDFFINLSESEGIPVTIMEAFSFGIPVIATNVGGVSEIVIDNFNGFLLDKNCSFKDVSQKINSFYEMNVAQINMFRINAYNTWENKFNAKKNFPLFVEKIKKL